MRPRASAKPCRWGKPVEPIWYYMEGENRRGPFATPELILALLSTPEPRLTKVWREGLADWQRAGAQPELNTKLPPRIPIGAPRVEPASVKRGDARAVALLYRRLVLLVGSQLAIGFITRLIGEDLGSVVAFAGFVCSIVVMILVVVAAYRLMQQLDSRTPALWALGMFMPLVNILVLLSISSKAQAWCKSRGIKVGLLGPTKESVDRLDTL
jgi:hypothetical protein